MAKKLAVKKVPEEPFDDEKYMKWAATARAAALAKKIDSIMVRAKMPFDGMCASLRLLGITPSFEVISTLLVVNDHTARFLAREKHATCKLLREIGVKKGGKLAV